MAESVAEWMADHAPSSGERQNSGPLIAESVAEAGWWRNDR